MIFNGYIEICNNKLIAFINFSEKNEYTQHAYYIFKDNKIVTKIPYIKDDKIEFDIKENGNYFVKVFVMYKNNELDEYVKIYKSTNTINYNSIKNEEFSKYINSDRKFEAPELQYIKLTPPKQDILIAMNFSNKYKSIYSDLCREAEYIDLKCTKISDDISIITQQDLLISNNSYVAFSGIGRTDNSLIVGMNDVNSYDLAKEISGNVGSYCLLTGDENNITFETDFFGTGKIYYYASSHIFLASNRLHLLILTMKKLGIEIVPNMTRIYASLSQNYYVRQNFCQELNIKGIVALRSDSKIVIDLNLKKVNIEKTELFYKLNQNIEYNEDSYKKLIKKASNEIIDNLRVALEHTAFEKYVVHITGGLDSRTVLCALSKLPKFKDKLIPKIKRMDITIDDFNVAMKILSKFQLSFDKIERQDYIQKYKNKALANLSTILGTTTGNNRIGYMNEKPYKNTCILTGFYGDYLGRAYYSKGKHNTIYNITTNSDYEFGNKILNILKRNSIFDATKELKETFINELYSLPGRTNLEKFENHYLYYRNGLHFSTKGEFQPLAPDWGALQSKSLLDLKCMTFNLNYECKV